MKKLNTAITSAMIKAYRRDSTNPKNVFVANIVLCKGTPFYGYHVGWIPYLKIYLVNPAYMSKLSDLLRSGEVMGFEMQPYEAHIPYLLQFLTDFNLKGCDSLNISSALFRSPLPVNDLEKESDDQVNSHTIFNQDNVSDHLVLPSTFIRMYNGALEIDIDASSIENRHELHERNIHHNFENSMDMIKQTLRNSNEELVRFRNIKYVNSLKGIWADESKRRRIENTSSFKPKESNTQRTSPENVTIMWKRGEELSSELEERLEIDKRQINGFKISFENFVKPTSYIHMAPTAFQTVEFMCTKLSISITRLKKNNFEEATIAGFSNYLDENQNGIILDSHESTSISEDEHGTDLDQEENQIDDLKDLENLSSFSDFSIAASPDSNKNYILDETSELIPSKRPLNVSFTAPGKNSTASTKRFLVDSFANTSFTQPSFGNKSIDVSFLSTSQVGGSQERKIFKPSVVDKIKSAFPTEDNVYIYKYQPPSVESVLSTFKEYNLPSIEYRQPFYSNKEDIPSELTMFAGTEFNIKGNSVQDLDRFAFLESSGLGEINILLDKSPLATAKTFFFKTPPPSYKKVEEWCNKNEKNKQNGQKLLASQIRAPTQNNKYGFKYATQRRSKSRLATTASRYLSFMSLELYVETREDFFPDPSNDPIKALFWAFQPEYQQMPYTKGCILLAETEEEKLKYQSMVTDFDVTVYESDELNLLNALIDTVSFYDPDILCGYEINSSSWGYAIKRGRSHFEYDLCELLSRVNEKSFGKVGDRWGYTHTSAIQVTGRHVLNIWRILRNDLNLLSYSMENVAFHLLHYRIPHYKHQTLTEWFSSAEISVKSFTINYLHQRLKVLMDIIDTQEIIVRTSEEAKIIGIDFYSVFYRGSQFKVESILTRIAKAENFMLPSPSKKQVGQQNAIECLPLILEPETRFYTSPVVVLDWQSLYPSVMIAYNYCYSTCLGRVKSWRGRNKLGYTDIEIPKGLLTLLGKENLTVSPNGMIYVKPVIRQSLLGKMLTEFLETRVMVKDGMKSNKDDSAFQRLMNSRQLALKLIANVTYGYTSASFSGRMPCVEIADSIVQTGRETMENAIEHIRTNFAKWGAEVVYGDTDSLFIHFPGKTKDEAFDLGQDIANEITSMNPQPMRLKFEKVYHPCILQTKKRYVGYMYEDKAQKEPVFNAKGIETVRRDGTPAQQKIEEKCLKLLFDTCDLSQIKAYLQEQWAKIQQGKVSIQDFCFSKEVRLGTYKKRPPPGAMISANMVDKDPFSGPQYRERVPYVVISGNPGDRLIDRCVSPEYLIENQDVVHLDAEYYIMKNIIPPLERLFNLLGADIRQWYHDGPKVVNSLQFAGNHENKAISFKLDQHVLRNFIRTGGCKGCGEKLSKQEAETQIPVCFSCRSDSRYLVLKLISKSKLRERKLKELEEICYSCSRISLGSPIKCVSYDCPIYYSRKKAVMYYNDSCNNDIPILNKALEW